MKPAAFLFACFLLALTVTPAFGDSINTDTVPPLVTSFSLTNIQSNFLYSGSDVELRSFGDSDGLPRFGNLNLTVQSLVGSSTQFTFGSIDAEIYNSPFATILQGTVTEASLNSQTDILTGTFYGIERLRICPAGCGQWVYYDVTGTFSETVNLTAAAGTGSINITSGVFEGPYVVPEPQTLLMTATGLFGIFGVARRNFSKFSSRLGPIR